MSVNNIINIIEENKIIKEVLGNCPYELLKYWKIKEFDENEIILKQEEKCNEFGIIISGYAEIVRLSENGKQYCQSIYKKGNYLGELEIFEQLNYCCNVVAMTKVTIIQIKAEHFNELIQRDKTFIIKLTKSICRSFYELSLKASEDTMSPVKVRVCSLLLEFIKDNMYIKASGKILVKKSKVSDIMAVSTRSIDRCLKELKDANIIYVKDGYIYILDEEKLKYEMKKESN
ncbi:MAG: Crp/Fnr family transcriptional regulator [Peptostreptococcaceae bacterium]